MKKICLLALFSVFVGFSGLAFGFQTPEEMLNAVVKIRSIIPKEAHTAWSLGTEREGNGVVIDLTALIQEMDQLSKLHVKIEENFFISKNAHPVMALEPMF